MKMGRMEREKREKKKKESWEQQGKKLFIQPRVYSTLCSARRTRTMAHVNVPVWKQGNNDVRGREREERRIGEGEKTREIIVSNNNGNTIKHSSSF